jgi:phospholipase D1/2
VTLTFDLKAPRQASRADKILRPGKNAWLVERAPRASMLVDGAEYFRAVREAMLKAERSILIMGWDVHSRTRLVGESGRAADGHPEELATFLTSLVKAKPQLHIYILLWDFAVLYAGEREWLPQWRLDWTTPARVHFCLDSAVPLGASQHQKIIAIDKAIAFSGGLDLTIRRWDTNKHAISNRHRVDPAGSPYPPFHDVQALADGAVAKALADIFCERWQLVTGKPLQLNDDLRHDPWPESVSPLFRNAEVGIARTRPPFNEQAEVREVEQLFIDSIEAAERYIYIENQFLTSLLIADHLCAALKRRPKLEAVFVAPYRSESWIEKNTMHYGRVQFARKFDDAGVSSRARMLCPSLPDGDECVYPMIHSKVMAVDDKLFRIGSANLNNRSMGTDTECDLAVEADTPEIAAQIALARNMLLAEHCKCDVDKFAAILGKTNSLIETIEHFSAAGGGLQKIDDKTEEAGQFTGYLSALADPERPISLQAFLERTALKEPRKLRQTIIWLTAFAAIAAALGAIWFFTPLSEWANPDVIKSYYAAIANSAWAPWLIIGTFILASSVIFPVNVLVIAAAATFGSWLGFVYSLAGMMLGSMVAYGAGRLLGQRVAKRLLGVRLNRVRRKIVAKGVVSVAAVRLVPIAPFAIVNFAAGASQIKLSDYLVGTLLGLAPGVAVISFLSDQVIQTITRPNFTNVMLAGLGVLTWIALIVGAQAAVAKSRKKP